VVLSRSFYPPALLLGAMAAAVPAPARSAEADPSAAPARDGQDLNLLIAALSLDGRQLSDTVYLYEAGNDVLVPVGELARLLTIGVTTDPLARTANGFILREDAEFRIDPASGTVVSPGGMEHLAPGEARWIEGDLYVPARLLARWWPVDLAFDMAGLELKAHAREKLPVQLRLEREVAAGRLRSAPTADDRATWPKLKAPYRLVSVPAVDSTLGAGIDRTPQGTTARLAYAAVISGDIAGMEGTAFVTASKDDRARARVTLSRHDPDGGLLGPLGATSVELGNVGLPALNNVLSGGGTGWGATIGNRPLDLPSSYGLQTLRGELPQGWDVTLYFNEALIGFARSRPDGLYEFPDQPLVFGRNEFRLVFNGPLGQRRVETRVFLFDQSVTAPGEVYYSAGFRVDGGALRGTVQVDAGLARGLALTAGAVHLEGTPDGRGSLFAPRLTRPHTYLNGGLRASLVRALVNVDHVQDLAGGSLTELGLRTSLAGLSLDASRTWVRRLESDLFEAVPDPVTLRDGLRLTGLLAFSPRLRMPFAVDMEHERTASGREHWLVQPRLSVTAWGTALTNGLRWEWGSGPSNLSGVLQASRRVAGVGLSGQIAYSIAPDARVESLAMALDKALGLHNRLSLGLTRSFRDRQTTLTAGWTRNFGSFGLGFSGLYDGPRRFGLGLQLFTAFGPDPLRGRLVRDWQPLAQSGAVAARVFVDDNGNGRFDPGEPPVEGAGFAINGSGRQQVRTNAEGEALLPRLSPRTWTSLALDPGTIEDARLQPEGSGVKVLPRPGKAQVVDLPVAAVVEVDGTVWLATGAGRRPIGNTRLQLIGPDGRTVAETASASDGYFILPGVRPGQYSLRVDPAQLAELHLMAIPTPVVVPAGGSFVNGLEITVKAAPAPPADAPVNVRQ